MLVTFLLPFLLYVYHATEVSSFTSTPRFASKIAKQTTDLRMANTFSINVDLPPKGSDLQARLNFEPVLPQPSEVVVVRYKVPFGLNVAPEQNLAICKEAGPGGEQPGDALRFTSFWSFGLPSGDGIVSTAASFSGGISWQCRMFDVMQAKRWEDVVEALTSNVESRTDEVVLVFERPLSPSE